MNIASFFDSIGRDLRHALRSLPRRPGFTFAAVLTLALGIGATTAIFSVVYSVLIKPLPYPNAEALVRIRYSYAGIPNSGLGGSEASMYSTYRDENLTLAGIGLWQQTDATLRGLGTPARVRALQVTQGTLQALGVQPLLGRGFTEQEHGPAIEGPLPVILSYAFWQGRFGGDEAVLGRELSIEAPSGGGTLPLAGPSQVVGIMPPDFRFLDMTPQPQVILAVRLDPAEQLIRGNFSFQTFARLKPGVTPVEAHADIERMLRIWLDAWPLFPGLTREVLENLRMTPVVRPLKDDLVGGVASTLWVLMGAIGAVLLVACANIANLMLVRADERRQEFAVRAALGAGPLRIARELLVESLCLGGAGGLFGLGLAYFGLQALVAIAPSNLPRLQEISLYPPVLAFTAAASLASTLLFGSITALKHALHLDAPKTLAARGASASSERSATRSALVVAQVALALVLVVSAALMIRTFQALRDVDPGFSDPATIQTVRIWMPTALFPEPAQYTRMEHEILDKIEALPGVASVGFASALPMEGPYFNNGPIVVDGQTLESGDTPPARRSKFVSPGYFEAMGTRIIAGRDIAWSDIESGGRVALISEDFARELAAEPAGALGKRIRAPVDTDAWREVMRSVGLDGDIGPMVYYSGVEVPVFGWLYLVWRSAVDPQSHIPAIRDAIRRVNPQVAFYDVMPAAQLLSDSFGSRRFNLYLLGLFAVVAMALAVIGLFGVMVYLVSQRTREIGVRLALGASRAKVFRIVIGRGGALAVAGVAIGLIVAAWLTRLMESLLYSVSPMDPVIFTAVPVAMVTVAVLACYVPARRAMRVDPMTALRVE